MNPVQSIENLLTYMFSDGKQARVATKEISDKVADVGVKVHSVDEKIQVVIDGARGLSNRLSNLVTSILLDGKEVRVATKDISDKVADVGVKVECVDDKVQVVIDGA